METQAHHTSTPVKNLALKLSVGFLSFGLSTQAISSLICPSHITRNSYLVLLFVTFSFLYRTFVGFDFRLSFQSKWVAWLLISLIL